MKPKDRVGAWPAQSAWMRMQMCCSFIEPELPRDLYLQVRKAFVEWDTKESAAEDMAEGLRRSWERRKAG